MNTQFQTREVFFKKKKRKKEKRKKSTINETPLQGNLFFLGLIPLCKRYNLVI